MQDVVDVVRVEVAARAGGDAQRRDARPAQARGVVLRGQITR
jgi:hypothetical protein